MLLPGSARLAFPWLTWLRQLNTLYYSPTQDTFIFRVESTGVLPPAEIVSTALDVLQQKLNAINGSLQKSKDEGDDPMQVG